MKQQKYNCPKCGDDKRPNGSYCRDCQSRYMKDYRRKMKESNPDKYKRIQWTDNLKKNYGITPEDYERMYAEQNSKCYICGGQANGKGRLHIDHCHKTNKIRHLLCHHCNTGLGAFKHSPNLLLKAIKYLLEDNSAKILVG